jgi:xylan 1,4-beta-xylosidase
MRREPVATASEGKVPLDVILSAGVRQAPDEDAIATKAERSATVMVWNYHDDVNATSATVH